MTWLILSIILNTYVGLIFTLFNKYKISSLQGVAINYWFCAITGCIALHKIPLNAATLQLPYLPWAIGNGIFYFIILILIGVSTINIGVNATQTANKLSLVIPVAIAIIFFNDSFNFLKILGIVLALVAVYFSAQKNNSAAQQHVSKKSFLLPAIIFLGSGLLDTLSNFLTKKFLITTDDTNTYCILTFIAAGFASGIYLMYKIIKKQERFELKSIAAGAILGIPNYFSIYTLLAALKSGTMQASALIPVNNISVVIISTIIAVLLFKEKLNAKNKLGLALALVAIILIIISDKI
jgi:drug/metabolite transporter (DMT)-like permease